MSRADSDLSASPRLPASSYYIAGPDRSRLDRVAARVARHLDPKFLWLDFAASPDAGAAREGELEGLLGGGHLRVVAEPGRWRAGRSIAPRVLWSVVRPDDDPRDLRAFDEYLALPDVLKELLAEKQREGAFRVVVLANLERAEAVHGLGPRYFAGLNRALNRDDITTIATECGVGASAGLGFDFELVPAPDEEDRPAREALVCLRGSTRDCLVLKGFPRAMIACRREVGATGIGSFSACVARADWHRIVPLRHPSDALFSSAELPSPVA